MAGLINKQEGFEDRPGSLAAVNTYLDVAMTRRSSTDLPAKPVE